MGIDGWLFLEFSQYFSIFGHSYLINDFSEYKENTDLVILPGNGTFKAGVESIKNKGIDKLLIKILNEKIFLIGSPE